MEGKKDKIYFPNLNGLRFIAAFMVIVHHIEQALFMQDKPNVWDNPTVLIIGRLGVTLFFVLSGFLITYLLLAEEKSTGTISIKHFYIRRILRIWPLYYTIVMACFFIFQRFEVLALPQYMDEINKHFWLYFVLFVLFLPNLVLQGYRIVLPHGAQSWSVGVEEQFYLIWPLLMKMFKNRLILILGMIVGYFFVKYFGLRAIKSFWGENDTYRLIKGFLDSFQIYSMAVGALFAYIAFCGKEIIKKLAQSIVLFVVTLILTVLLIVYAVKLHNVVYAALFGIIIYNLACNPRLKNVLEIKPLNYLGKISYGLYMYHYVAIWFITSYFKQHGIILIISCTLLTVLIAVISYQFMEKYFINRKTKYSFVISGDNTLKNK